jgi:hypothetical protein
MPRKSFIAVLGTAAVILATPALAHPGGGAGGPAGMGGMGNAGGFGPGGPGGMGNAGDHMGMPGGMNDMRDTARMNSQGSEHASPTGIANANQNSVLFPGTAATTRVVNGALAGLTTGTTLFSNGTAIGTVQQIRTSGQGSVAVVIVQGTNGHFFAIPANKLTFNGGTLSTTARLNGINGSAQMGMTMRNQARMNSRGPLHASATGIAHANANSVLSGATRTTVTGVSVGMPLFSNGTQVGTVVRVVSANGMITRVLVQSTSGRIFSLAPSTLTASGGTLTTTSTLRGI